MIIIFACAALCALTFSLILAPRMHGGKAAPVLATVAVLALLCLGLYLWAGSPDYAL